MASIRFSRRTFNQTDKGLNKNNSNCVKVWMTAYFPVWESELIRKKGEVVVILELARNWEILSCLFHVFFVVTRWSSIVSIMILSRWNPQQNDYNWLFFIRFLPISFVRVTRMRMCQLILETLPIISDKCWYRMAYFCCFYCMYFCWNSSCLL